MLATVSQSDGEKEPSTAQLLQCTAVHSVTSGTAAAAAVAAKYNIDAPIMGSTSVTSRC